MHTDDVAVAFDNYRWGKNSFFFDTSLAQFFFSFWNTQVFRKMTKIGFPKIEK